MCSIMGYCSEAADYARFKNGFDRTISRGPDDSRIVDTGNGLLGFHRLAIMGLQPEGMQPFALDGSYVVCNGEIYGFETLKQALQEKGYTFQSGSDCEILLPLYREYGVEMFRWLDAEFALILYDGDTKSYIAARDPIGIRPLYYGYDPSGTIVFASEPKNLVGLCEKIMPFPPGHYYKDGKFVCYRDITAVKEVVPGRSGYRVHSNPGKADRRHQKASGVRRQGWLPPQRRSGLLAGVRGGAEMLRPAHPHLCHRHERGRH